MSQDANQRNQNPQQWTFTKYDGLGRTIVTGIWLNTGTTADTSKSVPSRANLVSLQNLYNTTTAPKWESFAGNTTTGYDGLSDPIGQTYTNYTISYYDSYPGSGYIPAGYTAPTGSSTMTRGLLTATLTDVLGTSTLLATAHYYDDLGRLTTAYSQHYLGGTINPANYDKISNGYDFNNAVLASTRQHYNTTSSAPALTVANSYTYDHVGRKTQTFESINGGANILLAQEDYNEVGQVMAKHLHGASGALPALQDVGYAYNERGWLLSNSAPLFQEQLQYNSVNNVSGITPVAQYNGNIASQSWGTIASPNGKSYTYGYDQLNRLLSGNSTDNYNESGTTYDQLGNIQTLQRTYGSSTLIDNLAYAYSNTNQLQSITDAATDNSGKGYKYGTYSFLYDLNGNLKQDNSKGLTLQYNVLNLPLAATLPAGTDTYTHDAGGKKLRKVSTAGSTATDYIDGIEYDYGSLAFIQTEEGRALNSNGVYHYQYNLSDHLGDNRLLFDSYNGTATAIQQDDYLPFGYEISRTTPANPKNEYLYNKKELQEDLQLYDYGARLYDPVVARWTSLDPLAEKFMSVTGYNYTTNDPVKNIDPNGMDVENTANGTSYTGEDAVNKFKELQASLPKPPKKKPSSLTRYFSTLWMHSTMLQHGLHHHIGKTLIASLLTTSMPLLKTKQKWMRR